MRISFFCAPVINIEFISTKFNILLDKFSTLDSVNMKLSFPIKRAKIVQKYRYVSSNMKRKKE